MCKVHVQSYDGGGEGAGEGLLSFIFHFIFPGPMRDAGTICYCYDGTCCLRLWCIDQMMSRRKKQDERWRAGDGFSW